MSFSIFKKKKKVKEESGKASKNEKVKDDTSNPLAIIGINLDLDSAEKGEASKSKIADSTENKDNMKNTNKKANSKGIRKKKSNKEENEEKFGNGGGILEDMDESCTLSWKARLIGFLVCALVGIVLVGLGYLCIILHKIPFFAVVYSLGSLVAILSTGFLVGPMRQFKVMMVKGRIVATVIYLVAIVATIITGVKNLLIPVIICMVVQILAFIFYSLTFMPFVGRYIKKKCSI